MYYKAGVGWQSLPPGDPGQVMVMVNGNPVWSDLSAIVDYAEAVDILPVSTVADAGVSDEVPRADHVHAHEAAHVAHDTVFDAKGDLVAGTAADTAAKLTVGANDTILMADSAQTTGLKYVAPGIPSTQAFGDAAAEGTTDGFTRTDHKHAIPANPITAHEAAADPHIGYVKENDASWVDLTDAGATTLHTHSGGAGHTIEDEGTGLTTRTKLNFVGVGVTVTDDAGDDASVVTIPGGLVSIRAAADSEETTTALKSHTELTATLPASTAVYFRFVLKCLNDGAAEGVKAAVSGTVGISDLKAQIYIYDDTLNTLAGFGQVTAIDTTVGAGLSSGVNEVVIEGSILTTTAGTFFLKFAQNAAGAALGVHIQPGSTMLLSGSGGSLGSGVDADFWVETANANLSAEVVVGTTGIHTAAYASRNAAAKAGRLFLPNNGFVVERDTGSAWAPWGPIYPLTVPVDGDFAWINQGGASVNAAGGGIYLLAPTGTAGISFRIRKKAAPATPYTITACLLPHWIANNNSYVGLCFREAATGEISAWGPRINSTVGTGVTLSGLKYTSPTAFSASYADLGWGMPQPVWLRIADNGTNRICSFSADGQNWIAIHTVGRTDFLTADEVGFFADANQTTYPVGVTLLSWQQT